MKICVGEKVCKNYVKCYLKIKNCCLETLTKHPINLLNSYSFFKKFDDYNWKIKFGT